MKVKNTLDFGEVLTPRRIARGVVCQHIWSLPDLLGKIGEDGRRHLFLRVPGSARESEVGELHCKAQAILWASMLLDRREVLC